MDVNYVSEVLDKHGYTIGQLLGSGAFAGCWKCTRRLGGFDFAVKVIHKKNCLTKNATTGLQVSYENELNTLKMVCHPNVIKIYDSFIDGEVFFLILEYCPNGTVNDEIKKNGHRGLPKEKLFKYAKQLAEAVGFLHSLNISHHDIKPCNCLIDKNGNLILSDFGMAKKYDDRECSKKQGTMAFLAPEVLENKLHDPFKSDIWAMGVTLYYFFKGKILFPQTPTIFQFVEAQNSFITIPIKSSFPPEKKCIINAINMCIRSDPVARATINDVLALFSRTQKILNDVNHIKIPRFRSYSPTPGVCGFKTLMHSPIMDGLPKLKPCSLLVESESTDDSTSLDGAENKSETERSDLTHYVLRARYGRRVSDQKQRLSLTLLRSGKVLSFAELDRMSSSENLL